jgi:hypothetical protein
MKSKKTCHVVYPLGKPMTPHLLRCQGFGVAYYSLTLERLESAASSTFATLGQGQDPMDALLPGSQY